MVNIKSPGRICLFGEHQDYLDLPVISMGISLHSIIRGGLREDRKVIIHKMDLDEVETFSLDDLLYEKGKNYYKSGIKICIKEGIEFTKGFQVEVQSNIPIQSGCGGSSSIMVAWIYFLTQIVENPLKWSLSKISRLAYAAEVIEFDEPGGMMDHYSSAFGGLIYLENKPTISIKKLNCPLGTFILGDSKESKDTLNILSHCKNLRLKIIHLLEKKIDSFDLSNCHLDEIKSYLTNEEHYVMDATLRNRDCLQEALKMFNSGEVDHGKFGKLLLREHEILRDVLEVSTPKIEDMLMASLDAGALGGKINGSGGGGSMFVYVTKNADNVIEAIEKVGGKAYVINQSLGVCN